MMSSIVCKGDETTHGGKVLEGIPNFLVRGALAAGVGHMVFCPKCNGTFPIIEGDSSFVAHGFSVALHGMRTACGAQLISSARGFADVEYPRGGTAFASAENGVSVVAGAWGKDDSYDERYVLQDSRSGKPLPNTEYALVRRGAAPEYGTTDREGRTHLLASEARAVDVTVYVEG
ncbi:MULTISPECIES: PAAR domain-containing protein [Cupriavidus]